MEILYLTSVVINLFLIVYLLSFLAIKHYRLNQLKNELQQFTRQSFNEAKEAANGKQFHTRTLSLSNGYTFNYSFYGDFNLHKKLMQKHQHFFERQYQQIITLKIKFH